MAACGSDFLEENDFEDVMTRTAVDMLENKTEMLSEVSSIVRIVQIRKIKTSRDNLPHNEKSNILKSNIDIFLLKSFIEKSV